MSDNNLTPILTNCTKLEDGMILCTDASPVIEKAFKDANKLSPPTKISSFYKFGEIVFAAATIYEAASNALDNLRENFNFDKSTTQYLNFWTLLSGMAHVTIDSNPLIHPDVCPFITSFGLYRN